jgi:hypothetical protein
MLRTSWVVFLVMGLASTLAFADGPGATDRFLFPGAGVYSLDGTPALVRPNLAIQNVYGDEAPGNSSGQGGWNISVVQYSELRAGNPDHNRKPHKHDHDPDPAPESWGVSDLLGFFALALLAFGVLIRLRVLRPFVARA